MPCILIGNGSDLVFAQFGGRSWGLVAAGVGAGCLASVRAGQGDGHAGCAGGNRGQQADINPGDAGLAG